MTTPVMKTLSFAQALTREDEVTLSQLPHPCVKGDSVCITLTQQEYERGIEGCKNHFHGRLVMSKKDKPITSRDLFAKLRVIWKDFGLWHLVPLGRGYFEFQFSNSEDEHKAWYVGTLHLKPGLLRLSKWEHDFNVHTQRQTHIQVWIRLLDLLQEYWRPQLLFEIMNRVGTPLMLDDATKRREFGHYARVLVDIDLSKRIYDEVMVERDGYAFYVEVAYEHLPEYCHNCFSIGHTVANCRKLHPIEKVGDRVKIPVDKAKKNAPKKVNAEPEQQAEPAIQPSKTSPVMTMLEQHEETVMTVSEQQPQPEKNTNANHVSTSGNYIEIVHVEQVIPTVPEPVQEVNHNEIVLVEKKSAPVIQNMGEQTVTENEAVHSPLVVDEQHRIEEAASQNVEQVQTSPTSEFVPDKGC
ncbi:NBS resistance protein [Trifolium medium]|uniref:NBS resistance protein n=1 Tax=Trifolium medium TaxID=97028 RepID=A0A392LXA9_9FABA|nr:NBS resistance protein [Trifolium medium]